MKTRSLALALSALALATASFLATAGTYTFSNTTPISSTGAAATPPQSDIAVSGITGNITKVTVTLHGITAGDLYTPAFHMTAPGGQMITLFDGTTNLGVASATNANWTFSSTGSVMPSSGVIGTGTYLPNDNYLAGSARPPAPVGFYGTDLTVLNVAAPTQVGAWSLYVFKYTDSAAPLSIAGGWTVTITTEDPTTCASEGYTGTKLTWCRNICEMGYTGAVLDTWIHRWVNRYRDLPYCAQEDGGEEEPPPQET